MKVFKVYPGVGGNNPFVEKDIGMVMDFIKDADVDSYVSIWVMEMTEDEYENLPEYTGP